VKPLTATDLTDREALALAYNGPGIATEVPVPDPTLGTWNRFPEPLGTTGTGLFEPLSAFMDRASTAPPQEWLIEGLLPCSGKVMVVAAPNAGKTWLALVAVKTAAALGRECFLVEEEGGLRALADRIRALGLHELPGINIAHLRGVSLDDQRMLANLHSALKAAAAPVLALDPLNSVWGGDENDTHAATKLRKKLDALCAVNPSALVMVLHHTSKAGERGDGPPAGRRVTSSTKGAR
jgi:RecA-family ATPase